MLRQESWFKLLLVVLVPTLTLGCQGQQEGPARGALTGQVSWEGESVQDGRISLIPTEGTSGPASGGAISEGRYSIPASKGPVVGKHRVEITASRKTGKQQKAMPPATGTVDEIEQYIPPKYNMNSVLTTDVEEGDNTADFNLKQ
tara:strand:+ start:2074 stop:2508 length:435 start_codon:yes stop_codon:yes gene_type:complete